MNKQAYLRMMGIQQEALIKEAAPSWMRSLARTARNTGRKIGKNIAGAATDARTATRNFFADARQSLTSDKRLKGQIGEIADTPKIRAMRNAATRTVYSDEGIPEQIVDPRVVKQMNAYKNGLAKSRFNTKVKNRDAARARMLDRGKTAGKWGLGAGALGTAYGIGRASAGNSQPQYNSTPMSPQLEKTLETFYNR